MVSFALSLKVEKRKMLNCRTLVSHSKDKAVFDLMNISLTVNSGSNFAADCMLHAKQLRSQELGASAGAHTLHCGEI